MTGPMTGAPIFGGWRRPRLSRDELDAVLREYDACLEPAPPIRWPTLLFRWVRPALVVRREP